MSDIDDAIRDAINRVQRLGGTQMAGFISELSTFMLIARQVPYITLSGTKTEPRHGTGFVGVGGRSKKGKGGILLFTGGSLSIDEARIVAKLLADYAEEVVITSPHLNFPANIHSRGEVARTLQSPAKVSKKRSISAEANTVEVARRMAMDKLPRSSEFDQTSLREEIVSDGTTKKLQQTDITVQLAYARAKRELPANAEIIEKRLIEESTLTDVEVDAFSEAEAKILAESKKSSSYITGGIHVLLLPKPGWLGFGKQPGKYRVSFLKNAKVEVTYRVPVTIRLTWLE